MDVYLLPDRVGGYFLYTATREHEPGSAEDVPDSETGLQQFTRLASSAYRRVTLSRHQKEQLLKSLGELDHVRILFEPSLTESRARSIYEDLIEKATEKHKKWMVLNTAALPVAIPLSLVPGPNVLLAYLAFRTVTHYQAKKAGERASELAVDFVPVAVLDELTALVRKRRVFRRKARIRKIGDKLGVDRLDRVY